MPTETPTGAMPSNKYLSQAEPPDYKPGRAERLLLEYLEQEFQSCYDLMQHARYTASAELRMFVGAAGLRQPSTPYAQQYPVTGNFIEAKARILSRRSQPDPSQHKEIRVTLDGELSDEAIMAYAMANQVEPERVKVDIENALTAVLRRRVRGSAWNTANREYFVQRYRHGYAVGLPTAKYRVRCVPVVEEQLQAELVLGPDGQITMAPPKTTYREELEYDGVEMCLLQPWDLWFPDLHQNTTRLPWIGFMHRRTLWELLDYQRREVEGEWSGSFVNLQCLRPDMQADWHSDFTRDPLTFTFDGANYLWDDGGTEENRFANTFLVRARHGEFSFNDLWTLFEDEAPLTPQEIKSFARKFGVTEEELAKNRHWMIEWIPGVHEITTGSKTDRGAIMVRFEPIPLPVADVAVAIFSPYKIIPRRLLSKSVYQLGCGELERKFNDSLDAHFNLSEQTAFPMRQVDLGSVEPAWKTENKNRLLFRRNGIIPVRTPGPFQFGSIMHSVIPPSDSSRAARETMEITEELIMRMVGYSPQLEGGSADAGSASESYNQIQMLEENVREEVTRHDLEVAEPFLRAVLAYELEHIRRVGGMTYLLEEEDLALWGDEFKDFGQMEFIVSPEMASNPFRVSITTASATGSAAEQALNVEKLIGLAQQVEPMLNMAGKTFNYVGAMERRAELSQFHDALLPMQQPQIDPMTGMPMGPQGGGAMPGAPPVEPVELSAPGESTSVAAGPNMKTITQTGDPADA